MITVEILKKLILSGNEPDLMLAFEYLKGRSANEIRRFFGAPPGSTTIVFKVGHLYPGLTSRAFKISADCVLFVGTNLFISSLPADIDLTL